MNKDLLNALSIEKFYQDLVFLMTCFREVLEEQGERDLADRLPWVARPSADPPPSLLRELQAFSVAFQLMNMVEENTAAQFRRRVESELGFDAERGLWGHRLRQLRDAGLDGAAVADALRRVRVEPVLTAHPSEAKRTSVLDQHRELYLLLFERESQVWTRAERDTIRQRIKTILERLWHTGEVFLSKPDIQAELDNVTHYLRDVFPAVLGRLDTRLRQAWADAGFAPEFLEDAAAYPGLSFGTWVGGDRDGHPKVTADVTRRTLDTLRADALGLLGGALERLNREVSLSALYDTPPPALSAAIDATATKLGPCGAEAAARHPGEPWRQFVRLMACRLPTEEALDSSRAPACYRCADELDADLALLQETLAAVGAKRQIEFSVQPVRRWVRVFGFRLAALDIRQNSAFHDRALAQILVSAGLDGADFADWTLQRRMEFALRELESRRPFGHDVSRLGDEARAVLESYGVVRDHCARYGGAGVGSLIVSMTRDASDLFVVYLLAREAGLLTLSGDGLACPIPIVPLLERVEDLAAGPEAIERFLSHPMTRRSLPMWGSPPTLEIMVGYSDSGKESGILASQYALQCAQRELCDAAARHDVSTRFFHGRGGTVSRGSGPTNRFVEALPPGTVKGSVRLTEQGETVAQKYANQGTAAYNLELLLAGVAKRAALADRDAEVDAVARDLMKRLADTAGESYRALVGLEGFLAFYGQATPIDAIESSKIGSRPVRRTGRRSLDDLRAIPWVFAWTQSRFYIPGWYGVGSAVEKLVGDDSAAGREIAERAKTWPFLNYVLTNVETSLMSADVEIMRSYAALVDDAAVRALLMGLIEDEHARALRAMDIVFGASLESRRPRLWRTLKRRESPMRILHNRQIDLLRRWRAALAGGDEAEAESLLPILLLSINAIASGLRTTG